MSTVIQLTDNEKALLAREVAADGFSVGEDAVELKCKECDCRDICYDLIALSAAKDAVKFGWDAAMEYMKEQRKGERIDNWADGYDSALSS